MMRGYLDVFERVLSSLWLKSYTGQLRVDRTWYSSLTFISNTGRPTFDGRQCNIPKAKGMKATSQPRQTQTSTYPIPSKGNKTGRMGRFLTGIGFHRLGDELSTFSTNGRFWGVLEGGY